MRSLEELTMEAGRLVNKRGQEIRATPIEGPKIVQVYAQETWGVGDDQKGVQIAKGAPKLANAFVVGAQEQAPVMREPYWSYLAVQYYHLEE